MGNEQCIHYWIIDSMNTGRCRYCGTAKYFGALIRREESEANSRMAIVANKKRWEKHDYQTK